MRLFGLKTTPFYPQGAPAALILGLIILFFSPLEGISKTVSPFSSDTLREFRFDIDLELNTEAVDSEPLFHLGFFLSPDRVDVYQNDYRLPDSLFFFDFPRGNLRLQPHLIHHLPDSVKEYHSSADSSTIPNPQQDSTSSAKVKLTVLVYAEAFQPPVIRGNYPSRPQNEAGKDQDSTAMQWQNASLQNSSIPNDTPITRVQNSPEVEQSTIQQRGSITRGFTLGSNQDPYLNSALDLQLSGYLTEDLQLQATLTDQNLPFQPEGATQTLNEFDRVHIALLAPKAMFEMGDVDLSLETGTFGVLKRRVQGASSTWSYGSNQRATSASGLSVQRGTFHSLVITPIAGVRGPYQLNGANLEPFITIVSGSERVYMNGQLLSRGVNQDYIIDYGLAEITFTGNRFIAADDDIQIEFQYLNREYSRALFTASSSVEKLMKGRTTLSASYIREADQNESLRSELLKQSGDIIPGTLVSGADSVGYSEESDFIRYTRIDTLISGKMEQIYRFIPGSTTNVWRVRFSEVGEGKGSYRRSLEAENGLVYVWMGNGKGNYEPLVPLQAPEAHQLFTLHSETRILPSLQLQTEWALSDVDLNRFSTLDDQDNTDHALRLNLATDKIEWGSASVNAEWITQHTGARFESFERIRNTEFNSFWGSDIDLRKSGLKEWNHQLNLSTDYRDSWRLGLLGESITFGDYSGRRGEGNFSLDTYGEVHVAHSAIESKPEDRRFERKIHEGNIQYPVLISSSRSIKITPLFSWQHEILDDVTPSSGYKDSGSLDLQEFTPGLKVQINQLEAAMSIGQRNIKRGLNGTLQKESESDILDVSLNWIPEKRAFETRNTFGLLNQKITPEFQSGYSSLKRFRLKSNTRIGGQEKRYLSVINLAVFSEQKPLFQEVYVYTGPEIGSYVWEDLNQDNVQQVDEFFPELTEGEGVYSLQFIPSDQFEPVTDLQAQWQQRVQLINGAGSRGWDLNWVSRITLNETSTLSDPVNLYRLRRSVFQNPLTTIAGKFYVMEEIEIRDATPTGIRFALRGERIESLQKRGLGIEDRDESSVLMTGEWRSENRTLWIHEVEYIRDQVKHDRLASRNLDIRTLRTSHAYQRTWSRSYQTTFRVSIEAKTDVSANRLITSNLITNEPISQTREVINPQAIRSILRLEQRFFAFKKIEGQADLEWRYAQLSGTPTAYTEYELTGGTGQGSSWIWSLRSETKLNSTLRAGLKWNGRTGFTGNFRQTMEVSVRALF